MIEQPAGRCDDEVDALIQGRELRSGAHTPKDHRAALGNMPAQVTEGFVNLRSELARRYEDERTRCAPSARRGQCHVQPLQQRQSERGGLTRSGLRSREKIPSARHDRNGLLLDRGRGGVAEIVRSAQQLGAEIE